MNRQKNDEVDTMKKKTKWILIIFAGLIILSSLSKLFEEPSNEEVTKEENLVNEEQATEELTPETESVTETGSDEATTPSPTPLSPSNGGGELKVHFINVGQGDSTLIQAPNGKTMLVDGGPRSAGDDVVAYLKAKGITKLDYVVSTHPDADHIGGLVDVLSSLTVTHLIDSGKAHTTETYYDLLSLVDSKNIDYIVPTTGDTFPLDNNLTTKALYADDDARDNNDASIVLQLTYNTVSFLLMADADIRIESQLVANNNVDATVLKVGHHGSDTSSSNSFLNEVTPEVAILSYGENNSYGHPDSQVVSRLNKLGAKIYHTPFHCNIVVSTDGVKYDITTSCDQLVTQPTEVSETPTTQVPATPPKMSEPVTPPSTQTNFKNCTALRVVYPDGVPSDHPAYQSKMDRDKDGWACE